MSIVVHHGSCLDEMKRMESNSIDFIYVDPPYYCQRDFGDFSDKWESLESYLTFITEGLNEAHRILSPHGNICMHVDYHAAHRVRACMDDVFGFSSFRNEIVWCYNSGGASKNWFSRKHDNLFVYAKNPKQAKFNIIREPYPRDYGDRDGFHPEGRVMNDWWQIGILSTTAKERVNYATQKPIELLKRLVMAYTDPGDTVLDYCCGSGTTLVAATVLQRNAIGIDQNEDAVRIAKQRCNLPG